MIITITQTEGLLVGRTKPKSHQQPSKHSPAQEKEIRSKKISNILKGFDSSNFKSISIPLEYSKIPKNAKTNFKMY